MTTSRQSLLERFDEERRTLAHDGSTIEILPDVSRLRGAGGAWHGVIYSALTQDTADAAIARETAHHRALGVGFEWKAYAHDRPADLRDRLARHGFMIGACEAVMVFDLGVAPPWMNEGSMGQRVQRVETLDQLEVYLRVMDEAFGSRCNATAAELAAAIRSGSDAQRGYIAYDERDRPVTVGRLAISPRSAFAGLYGGGTTPAARGRGFYRALVAARAREAAALGAKYLQVDALPTSRPILERLGFQHLTDTWPCEWKP